MKKKYGTTHLQLILCALYTLLISTACSPTISPREGNLLDDDNGWTRHSWRDHGTITNDLNVHHGSGNSVRIDAAEKNDISYVHNVSVVAKHYYRFSAWVKTKGVAGKMGANLAIYNSSQHSIVNFTGDTPWTRIEQVFRACEDGERPFAIRLGFWDKTATGTAWFDHVRLEELAVWDGPYAIIHPAVETKKRSSVPWRLFVLLMVLPYLLLFLLLLRRKLILPSINFADRTQSPWHRPEFYLLMGAAIVVRLIIAPDPGFIGDVNLYKDWALTLADPNRIMGIYHPGSSVDYPPLFLYILAPIGWLVRACCWQNSTLFTILIKLPALITDLIVAAVLYRTVYRNNTSARHALLVTGLFVFNPVVLMDSAYWGQTDIIYTALILMAVLFMTRQSMVYAGMVLAIAFACKPQSAIFILFYIVYIVRFYPWRTVLSCAGASMAAFALVMLPFAYQQHLTWTIDLYRGIAASYDQVSLNAYNFWALMGLNWQSHNAEFLGIGLKIWLLVIPLLVFVMIAFLGICHPLPKRDKHQQYEANQPATSGQAQMDPLLAIFWLLAFAFFMFFPHMHERYLFPALIFMLPLLSRGRLYQWGYLAITLLMFLNMGYVFYYAAYLGGPAPADNLFIRLVSGGFLTLFLGGLYQELYLRIETVRSFTGWVKQRSARWWQKTRARLDIKGFHLQTHFMWSPRGSIAFKPGDFFAALAMAGGLLLLLLFRIGDRQYPNHGYRLATERTEVELRFQQPRKVARINLYDGEYNTDVVIHYWRDGLWQPLFGDTSSPLQLHDFYKLVEKPLPIPITTTRMRLQFKGLNSVVNEVALFDTQGHRIIPQWITDSQGDEKNTRGVAEHPLFDEQAKVKLHGDYLSSTYYDEIYHGRTAYEFTQRLPPYENTHPPLGKSLIAIGIRIFGMSPFAIRFMPALFGTLTIVLLFYAGGLLTGARLGAYLAALLGMFEFSIFTVSRYSGVDGFLTFFLLAMFIALYNWHTWHRIQATRTSIIWLLVAGIAYGLAIATKWSAFYCAPAIFLYAVILVIKKVFLVVNQGRLSHETARRELYPYVFGLLKVFTIAFVVLPMTIYWLSYSEFLQSLAHPVGLFSLQGLQELWQQQLNMFRYHTQLTATHAFGAQFYTWPLALRPLWLYMDGNGQWPWRSSISLLGNPAIWWPGLLAISACLWSALKGQNRTALWLSSAYLVQYLPWIAVERVTFIYHYYPCVPLLILAISYILTRMDVAQRSARYLILTYLVGVVLLFAAFYPAISGYPAYESWFAGLRWFDSWWFI